MNVRKVAPFVAGMIGLGILAGCSSASPTVTATPKPSSTATSSPTASPSKSATPAPSVAPSEQPTSKPAPTEKPTVKTTVVVIGADELRLENLSGKVLAEYPYEGQASPVAAIDGLTKLYGKEPVIKYTPPTMCSGDINSYEWDNIRVSFDTPTKDPNQVSQYIAYTNAANQNYERVVQAPNGVQIGFSYNEYVAKNPDLPHQESTIAEYETTYQSAIAESSSLERYGAEDDKATGVIYSGENDVVKVISAPQYLYGDC